MENCCEFCNPGNPEANIAAMNAMDIESPWVLPQVLGSIGREADNTISDASENPGNFQEPLVAPEEPSVEEEVAPEAPVEEETAAPEEPVTPEGE